MPEQVFIIVGVSTDAAIGCSPDDYEISLNAVSSREVASPNTVNVRCFPWRAHGRDSFCWRTAPLFALQLRETLLQVQSIRSANDL